MNLKKLMKVKDAHDERMNNLALCYCMRGYHSQYWECVKLNSTDLDSAVEEVASIMKNLRGEKAQGRIYIVDYNSKPESLKGNDIYCYLAFELKFHCMNMGGYYTMDGIENPQNWRTCNREIRLY